MTSENYKDFIKWTNDYTSPTMCISLWNNKMIFTTKKVGSRYFEDLSKNIPNLISIRNEIAKGDPWNADNYLKLLVLYKNSGDLVNATAMKNKILSFAGNTDIAKTASEALG